MSELENMKEEFWDKWKSGAFSATVYIAPQNKFYPKERKEKFKLDLDKIIEEAKAKYTELLMAVENKYPNESRHDTALRFIREAQSNIEQAKKEERNER